MIADFHLCYTRSVVSVMGIKGMDFLEGTPPGILGSGIGGTMDLVVTGAVAGVLGTLVMDSLNHLLARTGMLLRIDMRMVGRMSAGWAHGRIRYRSLRWYPFFGQVSGIFKVDSQFFLMPPSSHCILPLESCHPHGKSGGTMERTKALLITLQVLFCQLRFLTNLKYCLSG